MTSLSIAGEKLCERETRMGWKGVKIMGQIVWLS